MSYTQKKLQKYFDSAKIDYYFGTVEGLQKIIYQATGDLIPSNEISNYILNERETIKTEFFIKF